MPEVRDLDFDLIKIDVEIQPREALDTATLIVLRERYQEDRLEAFPPVGVYRDAEGVHWLADGHYRVQAVADALGIERPRTIRAEIRDGSRRDAIFYAAEANAKHGTPLSRQEKRGVVIRLLQDDEWSQMSDSAIARHVGVSNGFVSNIHRELDSQQASLNEAKIPPETRTVTYRRGGKEIHMKKGKIGRGKRSKAKKTTTTTTPTISAAPQDERTTNEEDDSNTNHNQQAADSQGFDALRAAWIAATSAERRAFLDWLQAEPVEVYARDTTAQAKRYESILSDVRNTFEDDTQ